MNNDTSTNAPDAAVTGPGGAEVVKRAAIARDTIKKEIARVIVGQDAVVDLLLNYDRFTESQLSIKPLIKPQAPADQAQAQDAAQ